VTWGRFLRRLRVELRLTGLAAWRGLVELVNSNDLTHSAAIAYYALLSLFPFLLLIISILRLVAGGDADDRVAVVSFVFQYFPPKVGDFVRSWLNDPMADAVPTGLAGGLALLWASLGVFGAVTSAVNEAWGVEKQRSFLKHRLVSFLMLVAAGVVMVGALLLVSAINAARAPWFGDLIGRFAWLAALQTLTFNYLATIMFIVGVGLVFYFIPNTKTRFRDVWVGAILTGALWRLALDGFSWYLTHNNQLTHIHKSIAAAVIFLVWIYVSSIILMYGVEFTASHARLRRRRREERMETLSPT
jgi:membrane protein